MELSLFHTNFALMQKKANEDEKMRSPISVTAFDDGTRSEFVQQSERVGD